MNSIGLKAARATSDRGAAEAATDNDPLRCPANVEEAEKHQRATAFAVLQPDSSETCPCCHQRCEIDRFPFFVSSNTLKDASPTLAAYCDLNLLCIFFLLLSFAVHSPVLFNALPATANCVFSACDVDLNDAVAFFRESTLARGLHLFGFVVMVVLRHALYAYVKWRYFEGTPKAITARDFTLLMHVPEYRSESQIRDELIEIFAKRDCVCRVVAVNKLYRLKRYIELTEAVERNSLELRRVELAGKRQSEEYWTVNIALKTAAHELDQLNALLKTFEGEVRNFANLAFVTLASDCDRVVMRDTLLKPRPWSISQPYVYWAEEADEPENYNWQNFGTKTDQKLLVRFATLLASIVYFVVTWIIINVVNYLLGLTPAVILDALPSQLYAFICNLVILIMGSFFGKVLELLTELESYNRTASQALSLNWKVLIIGSFNDASSVIISAWFSADFSLSQSVWIGSGIIATLMTNLVFEIAYQTPVSFCSIAHIKLLLYRRFLRKQVKEFGVENKVMQIDLNRAYEHPSFDVSEKYSSMFGLMCLTFVFQELSSYATLGAAVILTLKYIASRLNLFNAAQRPPNYDFHFTQNMFSMLDYCLLAYALSSVLTAIVIGGHSAWYCALTVTLAAANFGCGLLRLGSAENQLPAREKQTFFADHSAKLTTNYDRLNPLTMDAALAEWLARGNASVNVHPQIARAARQSVMFKGQIGPLIGERPAVSAAKRLPANESEPLNSYFAHLSVSLPFPYSDKSAISQ